MIVRKHGLVQSVNVLITVITLFVLITGNVSLDLLISSACVKRTILENYAMLRTFVKTLTVHLLVFVKNIWTDIPVSVQTVYLALIVIESTIAFIIHAGYMANATIQTMGLCVYVKMDG